MKFTDTLNSHFVPQFAMSPKDFTDSQFHSPVTSSASITIVHTSSALFSCPSSMTYAEVVKLIPRISELSSVSSKSSTIRAPTMPFSPLDKKPPSPCRSCKSPSSPNSKFCKPPFSYPRNKPQHNNNCSWRLRISRQEQNNQWKNNKNVSKCQPITINYNWRTPSPNQMQAKEQKDIHVYRFIPLLETNCLQRKLLEIEMPRKEESSAYKTEKSALCESKQTFRNRCLSESSQASEDSVVTFDRCSASYESEISSDEYEESEDDESTLSEGEEDCKTPDNSSASESESEDSDSEDEMEAGPTLQVGKCDKVQLPLEIEVPPPPRLRSISSQSSLTSDYDESDDDFIVFEKGSGDEEEEEEESEDETDNVQVTPVPHRRRHPERVKPAELKVRFADNDEICPLYDDDDFRKARVGEWEERARDSSRFRARIANCAAVIAPVLSPEHRLKIQEKLKRHEDNKSHDSQLNKSAAEKVPTSGVDRRRSVLVH